jgi:hypothetical protein
MTPHASAVQLVADHSLLLAIPAFLPAVAIVGIVLFVAMRDRREPDDDTHDDETADTNEDA